MIDRNPSDPFCGLFPGGIESLRVAWHHLRVPGPPPGFTLDADEIAHPDPGRRFARRTIQLIDCAQGCETLALIDKASPHSRYDLMISEVSPATKSTPTDVRPATGCALWRTGANFVRYCSDPAMAEQFSLGGGELHLALNCDPHTQDRESVQAAKQFHLQLLYWDAPLLAPLNAAQTLGEIPDARLRRQALDPLSFLGAQLLSEDLSRIDLGVPGAALLAPDPAAVLRGERPLGCLIQLPGWGVLDSPDFEDLIRRIHGRLESLAARMLATFTGRRDTPAPWVRHPPLPHREITARIARLSHSDEVKAGLRLLAGALRVLGPSAARRLANAAPARRMDLMTLNQPSYALNLHAPVPTEGALAAADVVHLIIQPKLFSGIGGAGLLTLGGVPSVRILRGEGAFTLEQWHHRTCFQQAFARFNRERLEDDQGGLRFGPSRRFADPVRGWILSDG